MFITKMKSFFKKYWFILLGAFVTFFAVIFPKRVKDSVEKKIYNNRVYGQQDVLEADKNRDEKIKFAEIETQKKLNKIEGDKQEIVKELMVEPQKELTEKLSREFNFKNLDN